MSTNESSDKAMSRIIAEETPRQKPKKERSKPAEEAITEEIAAPEYKHSKGVVIVAGGAPYYGNMAVHLAIGLKACDPETKIQLLHDGRAISHLDKRELELFHTITPIPEYARTTEENGKGAPDYFKTKLHLFELSIFERTIYLDADIGWGKRPISDLFDKMEPLGFTMANEGSCNMDGTENETNPKYTFWLRREAIVAAYMDEPGFLKSKLYQLRSEFIYFDRSPENKKFFETAIAVRNKPRVQGMKLADRIPDEVNFVIAAALTGRYPHQEKYSPIHWWYIHGLPYLSERGALLRHYFGISMGGFRNPPEVQQLYKALLQNHAATLGIPLRHTIGNKQTLVPGRTAM